MPNYFELLGYVNHQVHKLMYGALCNVFSVDVSREIQELERLSEQLSSWGQAKQYTYIAEENKQFPIASLTFL